MAQQTTAIHVADQTGAALAGAQVSSLSSNGSSAETVVADGRGVARIQCRAGVTLRLSALGFEPRSAVLKSCPAEREIRLAPASVQSSVSIVVTPDQTPNESVTTAQEISRTSARTVFDALEELSPAVFVTRRGVMGYGIATNGTGAVNLRGVGGSPNTDVLVVLDGRPDFQGEMGHTLPDFYSLSDTGSIRLTEGPASVLYGSNAMGGAVEIAPRTPAHGTEFELQSSMGSFGTVQNRLYAGSRLGRGLYTASAGINDTDGDRAYSAYHSQDGSLSAELPLNSIWTAALHGNYGHFLVQDPGPIFATQPSENPNSASVGRGGFTADAGNATPALNGYTRFYSTWGHNATADRNDTTNNFDSQDRITGGRVFQTWTPQPGRGENALAVDFGGDFVNYGGSAENFDVARTARYTNFYGGEHQINDDAGFVRAHWSPTVKTLLNAGLRYQQNSQFGDIAVPEFGAQWHVSHVFSLSASASRGFRNPTLRELYLFPAPNPNLSPEHEWSYESTVQARLTQSLAAWATVYYASISNQIVSSGNWPNMTTRNTGNAANKGVETTLRWSGIGAAGHHRLSVTTGYAYLASNNIAPLVPGNKANLGVDLDLKYAFLHATAQAVGKRNSGDPAPAPVQLGGYTETGLKLSVPVRRNLSFFATADNLLNHRYQVLTGYPMPGINGSGGFVVHF
ncbi:MAG: TonB-dependent receptor [Acidobacteriaceae bacterium]|nr:TonB-dependent receptor [Acidobacteriaceae bacterium]